MIAIAPTTRIFVYTDATDMRKGFCGLSGLVKEHFKVDLFSGHLFVFFNRRRDYVKILGWDNDGLSIWSKRNRMMESPLRVRSRCIVACTTSKIARKSCPMVIGLRFAKVNRPPIMNELHEWLMEKRDDLRVLPKSRFKSRRRSGRSDV